MKKSNRLLVKGMALLLALLMVLALVPVVFAAPIEHTDSFDLSYSTASDVPEVVLTLNAAKLAATLDDNYISKAEMEQFVPSALLNAYRTQSLPSLDELFALIPDEALTATEIGKLIPGKLMRDEKYFTVDFVDQLLGAGTTKTAVKNVLTAHPEIVDALLTDANCTAIKNAKLFSDAEIQALLTGYTGGTMTDSEAFDWILKNNHDGLVNALVGKADAVVDTLGVKTVFDAIDVNLVIDELGGFNAIYNKADKAVLKTKVKDVVKTLVAQQDLTAISLSNMYGDTDSIYAVTDGLMEANLTAAIGFIMKSLPKTETFEKAVDGSVVSSVRVNASFVTGETSGVSFVVKLSGDTTGVNAYAANLAKMISYNFAGDTFTVSVSDMAKEATVLFSKVIDKALASTTLTEAEKRDIFVLYNRKGVDLLDSINLLDFTKWLDATEAGYMNTLKDWCATLVSNIINTDENFCFADGYTGKGVIALAPTLTVETAPIVDKICTKLGINSSDLPITYESVVTFNVHANVAMKDVYEVKFVSAKGDVVFKTLLTPGTKLSDVISLLGPTVGTEAPKGWVTADGTLVDATTVMPAADLVLKVKTDDPTPPTPVYTVKFMADGKLVATLTFKEGDTELTGVPRVPNKTGYAGRWQEYKLGNYNIVVNAIYTAKTYTVRYNANGGTGNMPIQIAVYDRNVALTPCVFTRDGYIFKGWNTAADGSGKAFTDKEVVKNLINVNGITLYAQWEEVKANVYTVTFVSNGSVVEKVTYEEGATALSTVPAVPVRAGYTGAWESYTLANSDMTVNAVYTANTYTVAFNANGGTGTMDNVTMTYDQIAKLPVSTFTYAGYTFAGWNTAADGKGTTYAADADVKNLAESGEVTLYAQWNEAAPVESSTIVETTTTPEASEGGANVGLIVAIVVVAVAVIGGVVAFFVMKKKH